MLPKFSEHYKVTPSGELSKENECACILECVLEAEEEKNRKIFESSNFQAVLHFKWQNYAYAQHFRTLVFHILYVIVLVLYVNEVYINADTENNAIYQYILILGVLYPIYYESRQACMGGLCNYFGDL